MFITESWFWRGTQSAIFYYISCSPYLEHKYKRQRRKDAERANKEKTEIITTQPGVVVQPGPFQTNPDWAEEIIVGPGPPKGWKKEKILQGYTESDRERYRNETRVPQPPALDTMSNDSTIVNTVSATSSPNADSNQQAVTFSESLATSQSQNTLPGRRSSAEALSPIAEVTTRATDGSSSSDEQEEQTNRARPSMERRLSSAVINIKDTIKGWNLKRYEREDEILSGLNERLRGMWDRATNYGSDGTGENKKISFAYGRKRAGTNESEKYDWQRAVRNPEINELHPPTVSKLPPTRDEAAWMLLPPPSAAVMAGRCRPQDEPALRWPLAQIGRNDSEWDQLRRERDAMRNQIPIVRISNDSSRRTPDLSNSSSDEGWSDEEDGLDSYFDNQKRYSAPIEGWMPVLPKPVAKTMHHGARPWQGEAEWQQQQQQQQQQRAH